MSLQQVLAGLQSPDVKVRQASVVRLARSKDPRAIPYLKKIIEGDASAELRYLARKGMQFIQQASGGGGGPPRRQAVEASLQERNPAELKRNLASEDREVRMRAIRVISLDRTERMAPFLAARLRSETDPGVLATAIEALGELRNPQVIPQLRPWLQHADTRLRANTIEALGKMETDVALTYLIPHLRDPDNRCRGNAVLALRRHGRVNIHKTLENMLRSDSVSMQDSATFCLGQMGLGQEVFRLLALAMQSRFAVIRNQSRAVLRKLRDRGSQRAEEVLRRYGDQDEDAAIEDVLSNAEVAEEPEEETWISPEERAAGILTRLQEVSADASLDRARPERDRPSEVLARLQGLGSLEGEGPAEPERRADEVLSRLRKLGDVSADPKARERERASREDQVLAGLRSLGQVDSEYVDRREVRQAQLLNALRSL